MIGLSYVKGSAYTGAWSIVLGLVEVLTGLMYAMTMGRVTSNWTLRLIFWLMNTGRYKSLIPKKGA